METSSEDNKSESNPIVKYSGRVLKIKGEKAIVKLKDSRGGLERKIKLEINEIESKTPITKGSIVNVELYKQNGNQIIGVKVGPYVEKKYIVQA